MCEIQHEYDCESLRSTNEMLQHLWQIYLNNWAIYAIDNIVDECTTSDPIVCLKTCSNNDAINRIHNVYIGVWLFIISKFHEITTENHVQVIFQQWNAS